MGSELAGLERRSEPDLDKDSGADAKAISGALVAHQLKQSETSDAHFPQIAYVG